MNPLSSLTYIVNNKKKAMSTSLSICFGVFLVYFLSMIINQTNIIAEATRGEPFKKYSYVMPAGRGLSRDIIHMVKELEDTEKIIPTRMANMSQAILLGGTSADVLLLRSDDIKLMMNRSNVNLIEGRMPLSGTKEIILHKKTAASNGLKINDIIGNDTLFPLGKDDRYTVVGVIGGSSIINFASMAEGNNKEEDLMLSGMIALPKQGKITQMNSFLENLSTEDVRIFDINTAFLQYQDGLKVINLIKPILEVMVIIVLCITLGNLNYINFYQRRKEFGVLTAIGYTKKQLYRKLLNEQIYLAAASYIAGVLLSIFTAWILNVMILATKGEDVPLLDINSLVLTLLIPVFVTIFSILPSIKAFKKMDCVSVIEGKM
jgi:putative ABC transport system permease protein